MDRLESDILYALLDSIGTVCPQFLEHLFRDTLYSETTDRGLECLEGEATLLVMIQGSAGGQLQSCEIKYWKLESTLYHPISDRNIEQYGHPRDRQNRSSYIARVHNTVHLDVFPGSIRCFENSSSQAKHVGTNERSENDPRVSPSKFNE